MKTTLFSVLAVLLFIGCNNGKRDIEESTKASTAAIDTLRNSITERDSITAIGREVLVLLKARNYNELVKYFSSEGVLFSPYAYIDKTNSKTLTADDFLTSIGKKWILTWGNHDGTGKPIKLTIPQYLTEFVYNADYLNAEAVGYDQIMKEGNSINNLQSIFPNHHFIDYHFSGFDQKNEGMDWTSLKLVFEKQDAQYFLVAVIHDQWTI